MTDAEAQAYPHYVRFLHMLRLRLTHPIMQDMHPGNTRTLRRGKAGQGLPTWDVKATENSKMQAEMMDNVSCAQKLNHPMRLQASDALARAFLATSETAGLVLRGSSSEVDLAFVIGACKPLTRPKHS